MCIQQTFLSSYENPGYYGSTKSGTELNDTSSTKLTYVILNLQKYLLYYYKLLIN